MLDVLVLTTDPVTQHTVSTILTSLGYTLAHASTMSAGMLLAVTDQPRLILTDGSVPEGALDLVRRLRLVPWSTPPFLLTVDPPLVLDPFGLDGMVLLEQIAACILPPHGLPAMGRMGSTGVLPRLVSV